MLSPPGEASTRALEFAAGLVLALAVPGIACFCYYADIGVSDRRAAWARWVVLAWPMALVSGAGMAVALASPTRRKWVVRVSAVAFAASVGLLSVSRAHLFGF